MQSLALLSSKLLNRYVFELSDRTTNQISVCAIQITQRIFFYRVEKRKVVLRSMFYLKCQTAIEMSLIDVDNFDCAIFIIC